MMEIQAPIFDSLSVSQKRALILRDRLRYVDPRHLDTFIEGVAEKEPPKLDLANGAIQSVLTMVTLKQTAARLDLGNVEFDNDVSIRDGIYRVHLTVEDDHIELHTEEALPPDGNNLDSVPIHGFIAKTMVPMFQTKYEAILARQVEINEVRQAAYDKAMRMQAKTYENEMCSRLNSGYSSPNELASSSISGHLDLNIRAAIDVDNDFTDYQGEEPVTESYSRKRRRVDLDSIPQDMNNVTYKKFPDAVKVELFDNVVRTVFPHFNDLTMASSKLVSIYDRVGSSSAHMRQAMLELKAVLQSLGQGLDLRHDTHGLTQARDVVCRGHDVPSDLVTSRELGLMQDSAVGQADQSCGYLHTPAKQDDGVEPKSESPATMNHDVQ